MKSKKRKDRTADPKWAITPLMDGAILAAARCYDLQIADWAAKRTSKAPKLMKLINDTMGEVNRIMGEP